MKKRQEGPGGGLPSTPPTRRTCRAACQMERKSSGFATTTSARQSSPAATLRTKLMWHQQEDATAVNGKSQGDEPVSCMLSQEAAKKGKDAMLNEHKRHQIELNSMRQSSRKQHQKLKELLPALLAPRPCAPADVHWRLRARMESWILKTFFLRVPVRCFYFLLFYIYIYICPKYVLPEGITMYPPCFIHFWYQPLPRAPTIIDP